jgi:hypothetical protein
MIGPRAVPELNDSIGALPVRLSSGELRWLNLEEDTL